MENELSHRKRCGIYHNASFDSLHSLKDIFHFAIHPARKRAGILAVKNKRKKIEAVLEKVRPYIRMHGGEVELLNVKSGVVELRISGACAGCPLADLTYNKMVGELLKKEIPGVKKVIVET